MLKEYFDPIRYKTKKFSGYTIVFFTGKKINPKAKNQARTSQYNI